MAKKSWCQYHSILELLYTYLHARAPEGAMYCLRMEFKMNKSSNTICPSLISITGLALLRLDYKALSEEGKIYIQHIVADLGTSHEQIHQKPEGPLEPYKIKPRRSKNQQPKPYDFTLFCSV